MKDISQAIILSDELRVECTRGLMNEMARSPSGKARVCKTLNGGSIPPRASIGPGAGS